MFTDAGLPIVCNASPDLTRQLEATEALRPRAGRDTPIAAVIITSGDLDHVLGLFSLRESQPLAIYATEAVRRGLVEHNAICRTLDRFPGHTTWKRLELDRLVEITGPRGEPTGLTVRPFALPGKVPVHLSALCSPSAEDNIGLQLADRRGRTAIYAPGSARIDHPLSAEVVLFDGTFWSSDELIRLGLSTTRAEAMAHLPIDGPEGSLALVPRAQAGRAIYTHINNTNPILDESSPERSAVERSGWEIAEDGMEITL